MNHKVWSGILVYLEVCDGKIRDVSLELLEKAKELANKSGEQIFGIAIGKNSWEIEKELVQYPIQKVYLYETEGLFQADVYEKEMLDCIQEITPSIVLIGGTFEGRAIASRVTVGCGTGVTADCTELEMDEKGNLVQTRPAFGGNIMASIITEFARPQIATVREGIFPKIQPEKPFQKKIAIKKKLAHNERKAKIRKEEMTAEQGGIEKQEVLVVAGRGVQKKEDLAMLQELAILLGGELASSRALVEKGWLSQKKQIGLSGTAVSPRLIITCGVSGTVQFMAGMKSASNIIAINSDPESSIFGIAHFPICADLYEVIPELIRNLKE